MKERPILFSGPMVRAILDGRKTVTRRVVKPQPDFLGSMTDANTPFKTLGAGLHGQIVCPYGQPGDRLWVRETFAVYGDKKMHVIHYRADHPHHVGQKGMGYKPSIHMPRWVCRILLEITAVHVERLQDIREEQSRAEGYPAVREAETGGSDLDTWLWFRSLWKSSNGAESWAANPWVWVIEFKQVEVAHA